MNKAGDTRIAKRLLLFPLTINKERRWWKIAEILQVYSGGGTTTGYDWSWGGWKNVEWNDKVESFSKKGKFHSYSCSFSRLISIKYNSLK